MIVADVVTELCKLPSTYRVEWIISQKNGEGGTFTSVRMEKDTTARAVVIHCTRRVKP